MRKYSINLYSMVWDSYTILAITLFDIPCGINTSGVCRYTLWDDDNTGVEITGNGNWPLIIVCREPLDSVCQEITCFIYGLGTIGGRFPYDVTKQSGNPVTWCSFILLITSTLRADMWFLIFEPTNSLTSLEMNSGIFLHAFRRYIHILGFQHVLYTN